MPVEYSYIENGGIFLKGKGILIARDVTNVNNIIYETPQKIKNIVYQLCDYTEVEEINISSDEVRDLANQDIEAAKINPNMLIAIVGKKDVIFGLLRMWEIYTEQTSFEKGVFREIEDAKNWIAKKIRNIKP